MALLRYLRIHEYLQALGPPVESCTLLDILNIVQAKTVIIKMDIQGHECKAGKMIICKH